MRTRGFDKLWRWTVTDELDMPNGDKITVTARRLNKLLKKERDDYAFDQARKLRRALLDPESEEYKESPLPSLGTLSKEDILKLLEDRERLQLVAKAQLEFLSPSPSDRDDDASTLLERLELMDEDDETIRQLDEERLSWVNAQLVDNMAALSELDRDELLKIAEKTVIENMSQGEWWTAYTDACLKLGVFIGNKPFFTEWPTEADDDLKSKLLVLYMDADAAAFDFSS